MKKVMVASAMVLSAALPQAAHASEWGCQVLICLSDPRGPTTEGQCVDPINRLWDELRKRRPSFPTCDMAVGPGGRSWAEQGYGWYDLCPDGTVALQKGSNAVQGNEQMIAAWNAAPMFRKAQIFANSQMAAGIGDGQGYGYNGYDNETLQPKVCVGKLLGNVTRSVSDGYRTRSVPVGVYDRVVLVNPANSPNLVNVFVDDKLTRIVRW